MSAFLAERAPQAPAPRAHVLAGPAAPRLTSMLGHAGIATSPHPGSGTVTVAAAPSVEEAVRTGAATDRPQLLVCDTVTPAGLRLALHVGVAAVLRSAGLTPPHLAAAVHGAHHGDGRMPYAALAQLLTDAVSPAVRPAAPPAAPAPLTARQTAVLDLMAEGHGNAVIARTLRCSEHTVKNVIYELMARLQARNRAHAVAHAVRLGLI
ncbi:response regulator transcription factor [Kitasatospora sp. NPDC092286]|uniref:helix-turn-helix transcriptional regulator n=1 Tax=Kitasatospora sp. NPDC092286 TaxID=3364087 RepID=UPI0037FFDDBC